MSQEKLEIHLELGSFSPKTIKQLEETLNVKCDGGGENCTLTMYTDYAETDVMFGMVKELLDRDVPVRMRKCYVEGGE